MIAMNLGRRGFWCGMLGVYLGFWLGLWEAAPSELPGKRSSSWGAKTHCAILGKDSQAGEKPKGSSNAYIFTGNKDEVVLLELSTRGAPCTGKAILVLMDRSRSFVKVNQGELPNKIQAILPQEGEYLVIVQQARGKSSFTGKYCLRIRSSGTAWQTFSPTDEVIRWGPGTLQWAPQSLELQASKGSKLDVQALFNSQVALRNIRVNVSPRLKPFLKTDPVFIRSVSPQVGTPLEISVEIPRGAQPGLYTGEISLKRGRKILSQRLPVSIQILDNLVPIAEAGQDQLVALPEGETTVQVRLDASGSTDPDGTIISHIWIGTPDPEDVVSPMLTLKPGIYDFALQVTDDKGATALDSVNVTVLGPPLLMPLPEVTGEQTLFLKGISLPGATILLTNSTTGETKEIVNENGLFEVPFDLASGMNEFQASAEIGDVQSSPAKLKITYAITRTLHLDSISPPEGQSGSIVTLTGSGFTPDPNVMGVHFIGSEIEGTGSRLEGKGVVLEASETALKVIVPFIFLKTDEDIEVYVNDGQSMSNSVTFHVVTAQDPTPDIKGNEAVYHLELITIQLQHIFNKLDQWTKPNVPTETWALIEENIRRTQYFLETFKGRVNSIPSEEVKANLDAIFGAEFFSFVTHQLEQTNEILSHTTPCDIAQVIEKLNQILEPINTLNRVLDGIKDTLIAIQVGNGIACFFGCVPCCAAIPFLYEVYSTVCAIDSVVDAIRSVFNTVITMMQAAVPTIPSEWKVAISGPFPGISNHILYTDTSSEIRLYANFTNAGFEQLINMGNLRIDIPDPGGVFSILSYIGIDIEAAIEEALGRLVLDLAVDLLDIDEIRITFADINVSSTVREQADPSRLVTVIGEGGLGEFHTIIAGSSSGTGVLLNIQASCGNYQYPSRTKCIRKFFGICVEWGTDYPPTFDIEVIPVPYIQNVRWEQVDAWDPCCIFEPRPGYYEGCWKDELISGAECRPVNRFVPNQPMCRYDTYRFEWIGCFECYDPSCNWIVPDPCTGCWKEKYNLIVEGKGFSSSYDTLRVYWNGELLTPYNYGDLTYDSFALNGRYESLGYGTNFIGDKPGWISVGVQDSTGNVRDTYGWLTWFVPPSPDLDAELSIVNSSLYPGDTLYVTGNYFTPYQADNFLDLSHQGTLFQIRPEQSWVDHRHTQADVLAFQIPPFHEEGYSFDGKALGATLRVGRSLPCQANNCDQDVIKILPYESAGPTLTDDQDMMIWGEENSYLRSAAIGDLNGDGLNDLVVGVPEYRDSGYAIGAVFVAFGPVQGMPQPYGNRVVNTIDLSSANPSWDVMIVGDYMNDIHSGGNSRRIGNSLAVGDINGDGIDDLLIGTTDQDEFDNHKPNIDLIGGTPGHVPGKAYIFFGRESWNPEYHLSSGDYDVKFYGDNNRELGYQVGIGKIHGYGQYKDVVITAPTDSVDPNVPNSLVARAYVITGQIIEASFRQKKNVNLPNDLSNLHTSYYSIIEGKDYYQYDRSVRYKGDGMGKSLALGDINGDGLDDIVLGAPQFGGESNALPQGAVYVLYGRPWTLSPPLPGYYYVDAEDEGDQDAAVIGPILFDPDMKTGFARSVHVVDLNGDGKGEIVIGAPSTKLVLDIYPSMTVPFGYQSIVNIRESGVGQVYVIDGANTNLGGTLLINKNADYIADLIINGSRSMSSFGTSLSSGDINNDGIKDLLVGATGSSAGHVWVFYGDERAKWRDTAGQDMVHLENRRWYDFQNPKGIIGGPDYATNPGAPLEEGTDYLFIGPRQNQTDRPGFGAFVSTGDLYPYIGDDVLIADPIANAPNAPFSGMLYVFYQGSQISPLTISPATVDMNYCNSEQTFTVSGGLAPYQFKWGSCYQTYIGQPPFQIPGEVLCSEDFPLPDNFEVAYGENTVLLRINGCVPNDLKDLWLKVYDSYGASATREVNFLKPEPDISVSPTSIDFGDIVGNYKFRRQTIEVTNTGQVDLQINSIDLIGSTYFSQTNDCPNILPASEYCTVTIEFRPIAAGLYNGTITIRSNDPDEEVTNVGISANVIGGPDIQVIPTNLEFPEVPLGSSLSKNVTITNMGISELHISEISITGTGHENIEFGQTNNCSGVLGPGASCVITVTFTPPNTYMAWWATLSISSDDSDEPQVDITLSGYGIPSALSLSPQVLDMGDWMTSSPLYITNESSACVPSLNWEIAGGLPSWLSVLPTSGTVTSCGGAYAVTVQVDRSSLPVGVYRHTILVNSNSGSGSVEVRMSVAQFLSATPVTIDFEEARKRLPFTIRNTSDSNTSLNWNIAADLPSWLTASQMSGVIPAGGSATVYLYANRTGLNMNQTYTHTLSLTSNGGDLAIPVSLSVPIPLATFAKYYGGDGYQYASVVRPTSDGGFIATGISDSFGAGYGFYYAWVLKLDPSGYVEWEKIYGPVASDQAYDILETSDAGYIMAAVSYSFAAYYGLWLVKLDAFGDIEWQKFFEAGVDDYFGYVGVAFRIKETGNGNFIIAGNKNVKYGPRINDWSLDVWVINIDSSGNIQWEKTYGGSHVDYAHSIQVTADGGYVVAGVARSFTADNNRDMWVLKLDSDGDLQWQKTYGGSGWDIANEIQQTSDGGYIVIGHSSFGYAQVLKLDPSGGIEWQKTFGGFNGYGYSIKQTRDGGYILAGSFYRSDRGDDIWVVKLDPSGNIEWQKTYGGSRVDVAYSIEQTSEGDYILAGYTNSFRSDRYDPIYDAFVLKIDSVGNIGESCDMIEWTNIVPEDTNIVSVDTSITAIDSSTATRDTHATVIDSLAVTGALCSETIPEAGQRPLMDIDVSPMSVDFGDVFIGDSLSQSFIVRNLGYRPINISNITLSGSVDFQMTHNCPSVLDIVQRCEISVTFTPYTEGPQWAYLWIESNDPDEGLIEIPITGSGSSGECPPEECPSGDIPPPEVIPVGGG